MDDLIDTVSGSHQDPLDRVTVAMQLAEELDEVADSLIGHFVDQARRAGAPWSEIGRSMGMSKQAAQKRFGRTQPATPLDPSQGFSRFNEEARAVVVTAQTRARATGNDTIGVVHLMLGLIAADGSTAAHCLTAQGLSLAEIERTAGAMLAPAGSNLPALIPFDPHAKDALERTSVEAQRRGAARTASAVNMYCWPSWPSNKEPVFWRGSVSRRKASKLSWTPGRRSWRRDAHSDVGGDVSAPQKPMSTTMDSAKRRRRGNGLVQTVDDQHQPAELQGFGRLGRDQR